MFCSWLAFSLGSVHMFFARFSFFGSTWQHIRVPHQNILMQENQVWSLDNMICHGILGASATSMNRIHVIMMPYHKFSFFFGWQLPWNGCWSKNVRLFSTAIVIPRLGVFFSYGLLLSLAWCWYLSICRLSTITANKKKWGKLKFVESVSWLWFWQVALSHLQELWLCARSPLVMWTCSCRGRKCLHFLRGGWKYYHKSLVSPWQMRLGL